eukprot:763996-Hanusia_phi.AAC.3
MSCWLVVSSHRVQVDLLEQLNHMPEDLNGNPLTHAPRALLQDLVRVQFALDVLPALKLLVDHPGAVVQHTV